MLAMSLAFLLGTIIALGSLVSIGGKLDTERLTAAPLSLPTLLVSCLDPLAMLLEVAALVLIVIDSKYVGNPHCRLALTAAIFFIIWALLNVGGFLPLSFIGMRRGSLRMVKAGQMVKAGAALLQYAIPFLLIYGLSHKTSRMLLWIALILTVVGNFGVVVLPIRGVALEAIDTAGQTLYAPRFSVDYTKGIYPVLLGMGYTGGALYMIAYGLLTVRFFKEDKAR
jgi:hypothetical protein